MDITFFIESHRQGSILHPPLRTTTTIRSSRVYRTRRGKHVVIMNKDFGYHIRSTTLSVPLRVLAGTGRYIVIRYKDACSARLLGNGLHSEWLPRTDTEAH